LRCSFDEISAMGDDILDSTKKGWLTSILELGAWVGALYGSFLADMISRKRAIIFSASLIIVGAVVQCTAVLGGAPCILGGRFVVGMKASFIWCMMTGQLTKKAGMGVGANSMLIPLYNAEVAPAEIRGSLVALNNCALGFGIM
jgi:MFS family permease